MNSVFLLIGTNLGDKAKNMEEAILQISNLVGNITKQSPLYETAAWGNTNQGNFLNAVIEVECALKPIILLDLLLKIEKEMGRVRKEKWGERLIDIDILYYNNEIVTLERLKIPHPELHHRKFTLIPLCAIAPNTKHPVFAISNQALLKQCKDETEVKVYTTL